MAILKITQKKSRIGATERQKKNLDALGLHKINQSVYHDDSAIILGMIAKVNHLVVVENVKERPEKSVSKSSKTETPKVVKEVKAAPKAETVAPKSAPKAEKPAPKAAPKTAASKESAPKTPAKPKAAPKKEVAPKTEKAAPAKEEVKE